MTMKTYELILSEYFGLPENHKHYDTTMEFDTEGEFMDDGRGELVVHDYYVKVFSNEPITSEDLVELSKEFLPERDQWTDVDHMLGVFTEELNN
tara:strand:- start:646 stop:927 length:282 start_codon:yes stop_codon:yes gene_type:complete